MKDKKIVMYTVVTGHYDDVLPHTYICEDWDYICFSDSKFPVENPWKMVIFESSSLDNSRKSRWGKILPHRLLSAYDYSIYIDANLDVRDDTLQESVKRHIAKGNRIAFSCHPLRDCLYEEADICVQKGKDSGEVIYRQTAEYKEDGMPQHAGLYSGALIFRQHNDKGIIRCMELWWEELNKHSRRDQISLPYVLHQCGIKPSMLFFGPNKTYFGTDSFAVRRHRLPQSVKILRKILLLLTCVFPTKSMRSRQRACVNEWIEKKRMGL